MVNRVGAEAKSGLGLMCEPKCTYDDGTRADVEWWKAVLFQGPSRTLTLDGHTICGRRLIGR